MVFIIFIQILIEDSVSKEWRPKSDMAKYVAFDLGLQCICPTKRGLALYGLRHC